MIRRTNSQKLIFSDGTSQEDRYQDALDPGYVEVDGRSIDALIQEAQRLAKEIQFFDEEDNPVSNWESLFIENAEEYQAKKETGKAILRSRWAKQLAGYVEHPESFQNDPEKLGRLSRPHLVLFMTFLRLMNHIKSQINGLTKKHLDFYFLERLGFTPKDAVPDVVNVLMELASDVEQLEVKKGTVLFGGTDDDGNELQYKTDKDAVISRANIAQLKTVFVDKATLTIRDTHLNHLDDPDRGFIKMVEMALGSPEPGDALPPFPSSIEDLVALHTKVVAGDTAALDYVSSQLFFSPKEEFKDFKTMMQIHLKDIDSNTEVLPEDWEEVYGLLDQTYKNGVKQKRKLVLQAIRENGAGNGLDELLKHVYGNPDPGDSLPLYRGNLATVTAIHSDFSAAEAGSTPAEQEAAKAKQQEANEYISEELQLSEKEFAKLALVAQSGTTTTQEWEEIYTLLELANRKVRSESIPSPERKELFNVYAEKDAKANAFSLYGQEEESVRFKTFGGGQPGVDQLLKPASIGFAISSPLLMLREGKRQISTTVAFMHGSGDAEELKALFNQEENEVFPFKIFLSSEEKWVQASNPVFSFGDHVMGGPVGTYTGTIDENEVTISTGGGFSLDDIGNYLVWTDGTVYEIMALNPGDTVTVANVGQVDAPGQILKYERSDIYPNALKVTLELQDEDLPFVPVTSGPSDAQLIYPEFPAMVFSLNHLLVEQRGKQSLRSQYQKLMDLKMDRVHLQVNVEGIRDLTLQNDRTNINVKKPFEPFGISPEVGNSFYLTHPELCHKRLDGLTLDMEWMTMPTDFKEHYKNYSRVEANNATLNPSAFEIQGKGDFKAKVLLYDNRAELEVATLALFSNDGKVEISGIPDQLKTVAPAFSYKSNVDYQVDEDVLDSDRYFKLELDPKDFQHSVYSGLFRKQAVSDFPAVQKLNINAPYTPKMKSLRVGYSSHTEILLGEAGSASQDLIYHLHPFGYSQMKPDADPYLLPQYKQEGTLYMGIEKLIAPETLSVLFQMSEGSADPEVEKSAVQWCYLADNEWKPLPASSILSDTTNGLLNTGIVQLDIPASASNQNTLLPGKLHWLKVTCDFNTAAISDTIEIVTQAVSATFSSEVVAASHFGNLLAPESITETLDFNPGIKGITQPYTSSKGKAAEEASTFYNRISERIRHKNRAVNMWDYERMVLEQFPEIYKVKCLPATSEQNKLALGAVNVLVIPDIKGKLPFNPFEPKVPADTLFQVQQFLDGHAPAYADVTVRNPTYLQLMVRCVVKFKEGYNEGFYKPKLIDELKQFLAPWAYDKGGNITIGGSIYASVITNFIAERPYIEYVANMKLFQSENGKQFTDVRSLNNGENRVIAIRPDTVMVSAQSHVIDIVDENGYDEDNFEGINYMKVELDFQVAKDVLS